MMSSLRYVDCFQKLWGDGEDDGSRLKQPQFNYDCSQYRAPTITETMARIRVFKIVFSKLEFKVQTEVKDISVMNIHSSALFYYFIA